MEGLLYDNDALLAMRGHYLVCIPFITIASLVGEKNKHHIIFFSPQTPILPHLVHPGGIIIRL